MSAMLVHALTRKVTRLLSGGVNILRGYNFHVNRDKLALIDYVFTTVLPDANSFADLGGVWRVNAAYTKHILDHYRVKRGVLVDTDIPDALEPKLRRFRNLDVFRSDFAATEAVSRVGMVDVTIFFDVLLHQANPHWDEVLSLYARNTGCIVIYNQQLVNEPKSIRLTDLSLGEYTALTSDRREEMYQYVYEYKDEIHPRYEKPWGDVHSIAQWGITDSDLREHMTSLCYKECYFKNHGMFLELPAFENHSFVFLRDNRT